MGEGDFGVSRKRKAVTTGENSIIGEGVVGVACASKLHIGTTFGGTVSSWYHLW
jgi:hypothetical protein